ncbi:MAG: hypothetical protein HY981_00875 [Candidatus Magasanikbacteria bacterium]|nr:hypothetical protein [Candidatus Magasanikbacteria bacterium]
MQKHTLFLSSLGVGALAIIFAFPALAQENSNPLGPQNNPSSGIGGGQTCNVKGVEMPGPCSNYESNNGAQGQNGFGPNDQSMGQENGFNGQEGGQNGPSEEQQKQNDERRLKDMKRGSKGMEGGLKQYEKNFSQAEKKGVVIPQEIKDKLAQLRTLVDSAKNASTVEELDALDLGSAQELMQSLNDAQRELVENAQRLEGMKRGNKGMKQGVIQFEKQLARLAKQRVAIPTDITEKVEKAKTLLNAIANAKTWDEAEAAGIEDMQDIMMTLDQSRQQLEMLARWPQTLKQIERELGNFARQLKQNKAIADRLNKRGVDVTDHVSALEEAINKLKSVRDDAVSKIAAGESQEAFDLIENDFFGQMDDVFQHVKVIQMMNNLGRFVSDFKRGMADAARELKMREKKGIEVAEARATFEQAKAQGENVLALIKTKPLDEDAVLDALETFEESITAFENQMGELGGGQEEQMPWEKGPQQFKKFEVPKAVNQIMLKVPKKKISATAIDQ